MVLVSCPVHDELLAAQMFSSLPVPAQAVGRFALFVAEVQALSFGVDEDDRNVAAVPLAVGAHDVLEKLLRGETWKERRCMESRLVGAVPGST